MSAVNLALTLVVVCASPVPGDARLQRLVPDATTHVAYVRGAKITFDSKGILAPHGDSIKVWSAGKSKQVLAISGHEEDVTAFDVSSNASLVASGDLGGSVYLWQLPSILKTVSPVELLVVLPRDGEGRGAKTRPVNSRERVLEIAFAPKRPELAAAFFDEDGGFIFVVWDWIRRFKIQRLELKMKRASQLCELFYSADGGCLIAGVYGVERVRRGQLRHFFDVYKWDTDKPEEGWKQQHFNDVWRMAISADAKLLAALCQPLISPQNLSALGIRDMTSGTSSLLGGLIYQASGQIAFSPDGRYLATGGNERPFSVVLWDVQTKRPIVERLIPESLLPTSGVAQISIQTFSPNGRFVVFSVLSDTTLRSSYYSWQPPTGSTKNSAIGTPEYHD